MNYKTKLRSIRTFYGRTGAWDALHDADWTLLRFRLQWGRSGMHGVSVYDARGDRRAELGAGGCGYDKAGTALGHVLAALIGPALVDLARSSWPYKDADDACLYGMRWSIYRRVTRGPKGGKLSEPRWEYDHEMTEKHRERSKVAPRKLPEGYELRVGLDGGCGHECMVRIAMLCGVEVTYQEAGKWARCYQLRRLPRIVKETTTYEDGRTYTTIRAPRDDDNKRRKGGEA